MPISRTAGFFSGYFIYSHPEFPRPEIQRPPFILEERPQQLDRFLEVAAHCVHHSQSSAPRRWTAIWKPGQATLVFLEVIQLFEMWNDRLQEGVIELFPYVGIVKRPECARSIDPVSTPKASIERIAQNPDDPFHIE